MMSPELRQRRLQLGDRLMARAISALQEDDFVEAAAWIQDTYELHESFLHLRPVTRIFGHDINLLQAKAHGLFEAGCVIPAISDILVRCATLRGQYDEVRRNLDYARFIRIDRLPPIDRDERAALIGEFLQDVTPFGPAGPPAKLMLQRLGLEEGCNDAPASLRLLARIRPIVQEYIDRLADADQDIPFVAGRPREFFLRGWSVVSGAQSYHSPHFHQKSWANGVYYINIPAILARSESHAGWLHIGDPGAAMPFTPEQGWQRSWLRPENDLMIIMPGHFYHNTVPIGVDDLRIAFGFDIKWPALPRARPDPSFIDE